MTRLRDVVRRLNDVPAFASDGDEAQRGRLFHEVALMTMGITTVLLLALLAAQPGHGRRIALLLAIVNGAGVALLELNRRGRSKLASQLFVSSLIVMTTVMSFSAGGVRSPGVGMYFIFVFMAGILLGERTGLITAGVCSLLGLGLVLIELSGHLPPPIITYGAPALWILSLVYMGVVTLLMRYAMDVVRGALARAEGELTRRRAAQEELARSLVEVGERVKELRLMHASTQLLRDQPVDRAILEELVTLIPSGFRYTESCAARIQYGNVMVETPGWCETPWKLSLPFATTEAQGKIEVVYVDEYPTVHSGPFLKEEVDALESIRQLVVAWIERVGSERRRRGVEQQLRQSQKMEALGTLAGGIAHDFNNILTAILGNVQMAQMDVEAEHPARSSIDRIAQAGTRAAGVVKRILQFSRRQEVARRSVQLSAIVDEAVRLLEVTMPKNIVAQRELPVSLPPVSGDASQLYQVVMNLGANAIHAMTPAGGILQARIELVAVGDLDTDLLVDLTPGLYVRLIVTDTGVGMTDDTRDRLFEPFFTTKGPGGTGLGLSVVHGIVRDHDGAITVKSELGKGTSFTVYLPAASMVAESTAPAAEPPPRGSGERIMYVDDEEAIGHMMQRVLERLGYRVDVHTDPVAALADFRARPDAFDAVVTDQMMPVMNGDQLVAKMREIRADIPVGVASAFDSAELAARVGARVRIAKPPTIEGIARALRTLLISEKGAAV